MKYIIITILFFLPLWGLGQQLNRDQWGNQLYVVPVWEGWCEYLNTYLRSSDSTLWAGGNDIALRGLGSATAPQAVPTGVPVPGIKFIQISNGLHDDFAISSIADTSFGYEIGANNYGQRGDGTTNTQTTAYKLRYDSSGNLFDSLKIIAGGWQAANNAPFYAAVKNNGSVWMWGYLASGGAGNQSAGGTLKKPISVTLAGGKIAKFIQCNDDCAVLCSDSTVQTWGNDNSYASNLGRTYSGTGNRSPADIGLSHIIFIAVGYGFNYAVDVSGHTHFWGQFEAYGGYGATSGTATTPIDITSALALPAAPKKIVCNHNATMALLANGEVVSWGGIPTGSTAQGVDFNWPAYTTPASGTNPYNGTVPSPWNWYLEYFNVSSSDFTDYTVQVKQVAPGKSNFVQIFGGQLYDFDFAAEDSTGQFYQAGRNKGAVIANGTYAADTLSSTIEADFPVSWDQIYLVLTNPFNVTVVQEVTSPYCVLNPSTAPCPNYTIPPRTHPHASVTSFTTAPGPATLNGTASTAYYFNNRLWTQLTGPATVNMAIQTSPTDTINLTTVGTYTFQYKITDDIWQSDSAVATIIVSGALPTGIYFNTTGSDANPTNSQSTPWVSSTKFNSIQSSLVAGDTVYFQRGQTFPGTWRLTASRVVIMYYGTGGDPLTGGMLPLTFTGAGPNYTATCSGCTANTNLFTFDGNIKGLGQTPNAPYQWYTFIPGSSSTTTLYDPTDLATAPSIARVIVFSSSFTQDNSNVTAQTTSLLTFSPAVSYVGQGGIGWAYFSTPDTIGEWSYSSGTITCNGISGHTGASASADTVWYITGSNDKLLGLSIQGGNKGLVIANGYADSLVSDSLQYSGQDGIDGSNNRLYINQCWIKNIQNNAIYQTAVDTGWSILNTTIKNVSIWRGMGQNGSAQHEGINCPGPMTVIRYVTTDSIGFNAIYTGGGDSTFVDTSHLHHFNLNLTDGGGVYAYKNSVVSWTYGRFCRAVYADNGGNVNALLGTTNTAAGSSYAFYADSHSNGWAVSGLVSINNLGGGVLNHGPGNTYNNLFITGNGSGGYGFLNSEFTGGPTITGVTLSGSTFYGIGTDVLLENATVNADIITMLTSNGNKFYHSTTTTPFFTKSSSDGGTARNLASWTSNTGQDGSSTFSQLTLTPFGNPAFSAQTISLPGVYTDVTGHIYYVNKYYLPELSGVLLRFIKFGTVIRYNVKP